MRYQITKKQCQKRISGVCPGCGGEVTPLRTVDNSNNPTYWSGCKKCSVFCKGVNPDVFRIARTMVEKYYFHPHSYLSEADYQGSEEEKEYWLTNQTSSASRIVAQIIYLYESICSRGVMGEKHDETDT